MKIRKIETSDLTAVYAMVKGLAQFEKASEKVVIDVATYEQLLSEGLYDGHVAEIEHKVVGMVIYYPMFSTWTGKLLYLEDFYVLPSARGMGIGQQLFDAYLATARASDCKGAKWQVLDWNKDAIRFYERNDAIIETEWYNGRLYF